VFKKVRLILTHADAEVHPEANLFGEREGGVSLRTACLKIIHRVRFAGKRNLRMGSSDPRVTSWSEVTCVGVGDVSALY